MDKSDSASLSARSISIQQGDWIAYRNHIDGQPVEMREGDGFAAREDEHHVLSEPSASRPGHDSSEQPLHNEDEVLAYRRQCARAYIGMNGRLGGRAYHANQPVILTAEAVNELAELNRLLREERALKKKAR